MATAIKPAQKPGVEEAEAAPIHRIRITLTSKNVKALEKGAMAAGLGSMCSVANCSRVGPFNKRETTYCVCASCCLAVPPRAGSVSVHCATRTYRVRPVSTQQNVNLFAHLPTAVCADLIRGAKDKQLKISIWGFVRA